MKTAFASRQARPLLIGMGMLLLIGCAAPPPQTPASTTRFRSSPSAPSGDVSLPDREGSSRLHKAAAAAQSATVESLLRRGAKADATDKDGWTPLHAVALYSTAWPGETASTGTAAARRIAESLLKAGAPVDARTHKGETPLHFAARSGNRPVAELLLAKGAAVNAKDASGATPLQVARALRRDAMADYLRGQGGTE